MYRRGEVVEVNASSHQVRVKFASRQGVVSPWLDVLVSSTAGDKEARLPRVGNQVGCLLDEHEESGCVMGAVYSSVDSVPDGFTEFQRILECEDGARFAYDEQTHKLSILTTLIEVGDDPDFVALAGLVADELERINQDLSNLKTAIGAGFTAVGAAMAASGVAGKTAFDSSASSIPSAPGQVAATILKTE